MAPTTVARNASSPSKSDASKGLEVDVRRRGVTPYDGRIRDTLILLSHPPVITLGRGGDPTHLRASPEELESRGVEYVETDRGGDITFHGPGQIVGYTVVDLDGRGRDLHRFLRQLEEVLVQAVGEFGIQAHRVEGLTGVWVGDAKIAAMGIRVTRWITHHGFALNVSTDLSYFDLIVPCGIAGRRVTSMEEVLGHPVDRSRVRDALDRSFRRIFDSHSPSEER
jgi:lipoate-protein ligase B